MNKLSSFIIFLSTFLTLYGLLHFHFYRKVTRAFNVGAVSHMLLILILCFLVLSPIITNISGKNDRFLLTGILAYTSYIWMGALFLFFSINILIDFYRLMIHVAGRIFTPAALKYIPDNRSAFIAVILIIVVINIYGWFEAGNITVERIKLNTAKLPPQIGTLRIVQISDIHFSSTNGEKLARKIQAIVKGLKPDLLVSSGDLFDRGLHNKEIIAGLFRELEAPYGKYATTGNHEFIAGIKDATEFTEKAGFKMLRNESVEVGGFLNIAAIDDPAGKRFGDEPDVSEDKVLKALSPGRLNIFLKHQPRIENNSIGRFDLQLSGHTHKGQIFPFTLIVSVFYPYLDGFFDLGENSFLYVSRGTGTWGPPIRFFTFPEITVIEFQRK